MKLRSEKIGTRIQEQILQPVKKERSKTSKTIQYQTKQSIKYGKK